MPISLGLIKCSELMELGGIILGRKIGKVKDKQITIADLTSITVQNIQIVKSIL